MHEGRGPLAEYLEKFFRDRNIPYQIRAMGPASNVMESNHGPFLEATDDFTILSGGRFIPDAEIEKIREGTKLHYAGKGMLPIPPDEKDMRFSGSKRKIVVNMTPLDKEIRITVFEERELEETYIGLLQTTQMQTFKM